MSAPLFAADSVGKRFGTRQVLKSASVWGWPGQVTVLLGRNGCGKSTLLRCAVGQVRLDFGSVRLAGRSYARPKLHLLARHGLFFLPERGLLSRIATVAEHLDAVEWLAGRERVEGAIAELGLEDLLDRVPDQLSTGERRRVEVAIAIARRPACLLADEPFQGVAPLDATRLAAGLRRLAADGCALVVTGHEVDALLDLADTIVWMVAGTTHGLGTPAEAVANEQFRREYLGPRGAAARSPQQG